MISCSALLVLLCSYFITPFAMLSSAGVCFLALFLMIRAFSLLMVSK